MLIWILFCGSASALGRAQDQPRRTMQSAVGCGESQADVDGQSSGCVSCHGMTEASSMHRSKAVHLGCADCHGGDPAVQRPSSGSSQSADYITAKLRAHPKPTLPDLWKSSANPVRPFARWLKESKDYIQFVNPGDLRVVEQTCGRTCCHAQEARNVRTSMMTHGAMLWQAALYNNGMYPYKNAQFGESYSSDGVPQVLKDRKSVV